MATRIDIVSERDIEKLVETFYQKVNQDELLSPVFNEVAKVNWEEHIPLLCRFWSTLLLGTKTFKGQPLQKHLSLPITKIHFKRWLELFAETIDTLFQGPKADQAKDYARSIADTFQIRMGLTTFQVPTILTGEPTVNDT